MKTLAFNSSVAFALVVSLLAACTAADPSPPTARPPFVADVDNATDAAPRPSISPLAQGEEAGLRVRSKVTLSLDSIRGRTFLYGSDLQYSGLNDGAPPKLDKEGEVVILAGSTLTIGHVPVRFVDVGDRLQVVQDQSSLFESDVNHPERLLHEFTISKRAGDRVTIEVEKASPALVTMASTSFLTDGSVSSTAPPARASWVRSVSFAPSKDLLMFETSIEAADGRIYEFMESLFPRDTLVPADYAPLSANPDIEPLAARFGFLDGGKIFVDDGEGARTETTSAARFNIKPGDVIDWYVTPNIPDEFLLDIARGIEGWNRYSQAMWRKNMIAFKGRLPAGVKIGDPRYNIVNWDTVQEADAAWESQAVDPLTGIQSHSLIYMPKAWFNFGSGDWIDGSLAESRKTGMAAFLASRKFLGRGLRAGCLRAMRRDASFEAVDDPETFGHELVRQVLFHEVGHALGLDHNFKGSLSYDYKDAKTYSTSVMDYSQNDLERGAFASPTSANGPLLEYDRQILSALYNNSKDIKPTDVEVPRCTDADVPSRDSTDAVNPFCLWYDVGSDPTKFVTMNIDALSNANARVGTIDSLPTTLKRVASTLPDASKIAKSEDLDAAIAEYVDHAKGVLSFFVDARVGRSASDAHYWLNVFAPGSLPEGTDEAAIRTRAFAALEAISRLEAVPPAAMSSLDFVVASARTWIAKTPVILALPAAERTAAVDKALAPVSDVADWATNELIPETRGAVLRGLNHNPKLPYYLSKADSVDYEGKAIGLLATTLTGKVGGKARPAGERTNIAKALATFRVLDAGKAAAARVVVALQAEVAAATDAKERKDLRDILAALGGP
jgi:hypothetical protein